MSAAYQGFEPNPYDDFDDFDRSADPNINGAEAAAPLFDLQEVQYPVQASIISMAVCSNILALGLAGNLIVIIDLARPEQSQKIQISRKPTEMTIYKIFLDPSGRHLIVSSEQGENWYYFRGWKRFKLLKNFSRIVIQCIAWNSPRLLSSPHSTSSGEMLIGATNGLLYEALLEAEDDFFKSQERYLHSVYNLPEHQAITGVSFEQYTAVDPGRLLVLMTTSSRIYQFSGYLERRPGDGLMLFSSFFEKYRDASPSIVELPPSPHQSDVQFYARMSERKPSISAIGWMTANGIYYGTLDEDSNTNSLVDSARLLPYPAQVAAQDSSSDVPVALALTDFHLVCIYNDRIAAIRNIDDNVVFEERLSLKPHERIRGIAVDLVYNTYWVYTDLCLYELVSNDETREIWSTYLSKGMYEVALKYTKTSNQRDVVLTTQAESFFAEGQFIRSAQCYALCSASFETVILKFIDAEEREAMRYYLTAKLERTLKTDVVQRMVLSTWLVELYLSRCNELEDIIASESVSHDVENLKALRELHEDEMRQFLDTYKNDFDSTTIMNLLECHGRKDLVIYFASVIGDFALVTENMILEEEWIKALDVLSRQTDLELYYRFAPTLVRRAPKETVDLWLRQLSLDTTRLIPSLLHLQDLTPESQLPANAVRYLNYAIFNQHNTSPIVHNLLVAFYVSKWFPSDEPILRFLDTAPTDLITGKPYYDLDYALRQCILAGRMHPCVHIYSKMGLWENSVDLALQKGDLELAKINADMPEDDFPLRKKLWLKITRYVVQDQKDIKAAMSLLQNSDLLKIEDILPFFPDFVVIDDFKDEICSALEDYSAHIDQLKKEMDDATLEAEAINDEIEKLRNRFITVSAEERCSKCHELLVRRQFYFFPCQHGFHTDCLTRMVKDFLPSHTLRRILRLQNEFMKTAKEVPGDLGSITEEIPYSIGHEIAEKRSRQNLLSSKLNNSIQNKTWAVNGSEKTIPSASDKFKEIIFPESLASIISSAALLAAPAKAGATPTAATDKSDKLQRLHVLRDEIEQLLASTCPLCEGTLLHLDDSFLHANEDDSSWQI